MNYSQNNEENLIRQYFKQFKGRFIDIGANDGKTLSNTYWCALNGWKGVCIEPSEEAFNRLVINHADTSVKCFQFAIGNETAKVKFFHSGEHLGVGDVSLLSTTKQAELQRWNGSKNQFTEQEVDSITWYDFHELPYQYPKYDLISIDAEGCDWDILQQINLTETGCKMLIIETNGIDNDKFIRYCNTHKMRLYAKNHENLIFVK
jgi:FkbM family methyltransferase